MKKLNFNKNWGFKFDKYIDEYTDFGTRKYGDATGAARRFLDCNNWEKIDLPHDWAVALPKEIQGNMFAGARANTHYHRFMSEMHTDLDEVFDKAWYRKSFDFSPEWEGKRIYIEFEGVYRDYTLLVNGAYIDRSFSGYTSNVFDITDHLRNDGKKNSIAVFVDCTQTEGWWYEGSGIYRNVNLLIGEAVYFKPYSTVIKTKIDGTVSATSVLYNDTSETYENAVMWTISDNNGKEVVNICENVKIEPYTEMSVSAVLTVDNAQLWELEAPYLYTLTVKSNDEHTERFGIREVRMDADEGFILNGKSVKLRGACVHQDFGGVGVALTDNLNHYKIAKLKEMGCNSYRASHNPPSPALLDACDELGMLVMDETRMFGTAPEAIKQLKSLVMRDINRPSVVIWSIGNEEMSIQRLPWTKPIAEKVSRILLEMDDTRPITYGGNDGYCDTGINTGVEVRGINYIRNTNGVDGWVDKWHKDYPDQPIVGTEESSYVLSRGGTENDIGSGKIDCSGDVTMMWGETPKGWVKFYEDRPYLAGGYMWTGFDYRGEPNPFRYGMYSSSFGAIDLCGMEKPPFYYYKAWWTDEPFVKLAPHWDYKDGETAHVLVYTSCDEVSLYVNERLVGTKNVERFDNITFDVPFEVGTLKAVAKKDGKEYTDVLVTPSDIAFVRVRPILVGKNEDDISIYQLEGVDKDGNLCQNAMNTVEFTVECAKTVGVGNGDPDDMYYEQKPEKVDEKSLRVFGTDGYMYSLKTKEKNKLKIGNDWYRREEKVEYFEADYRLIAGFDPQVIKSEEKTYTHVAECHEDYEYIEFERIGGDADIYLNGKLIGSTVEACGREAIQYRPFRFYADFKKGNNKIEIKVRQYEAESSPFSGYVKLGRVVDEPWQVRLHYGLARIFVKNGENVKINAKLK